MPWAVAAAGVAAAGGIAGSAISAGAAGKAASTQAAAANNATIAQEMQQAQTRSDLTPYQRLGTDTLGQLTPDIAAFANPGQSSTSATRLLDQAYSENPGAYSTQGFIPQQTTFAGMGGMMVSPQTAASGGYNGLANESGPNGQGNGPPGFGGAPAASGGFGDLMTQAQLAQTPGYQFARTQGLQAAQNAAAARGLGVSGAALKGAGTFATGLADQTYGNQFSRLLQQQQQAFGQGQQVYADQSNAQQQLFNQGQQRFTNLLGLNSAGQGNLTNAYNRLIGMSQLGENAAATTGAQGLQSTNAAGNFLTSGANATGAGLIAQGNAFSGGINSATNAIGQYLQQQNLNGGGSGGGFGSINGASPTQQGVPGASGYDNGLLGGLQGYNTSGTSALQQMGFYNPLPQY